MTRLKFAHRADAHIGALHMGRILEDGSSTALAGQHQALLDFLEAAHNAGVVGILNAGDETHTPRPTPDVLNVLMDYHELREEWGVREFAVEGNHTDRPGVTVTDLAGRYPHVEYAVEPSSLTARFSGGDQEIGAHQVQVAFLPWLPRNRVSSAEELTAAAIDYVRGLASTLDSSLPSILIVHATIAGGETSGGFSMGFIPDALGYKIPAEELAPFTYVAAGHLHRPQQVGPNAWYSGSLFPVDFSEDHPHGWNLVTLCNEADGPIGDPFGSRWHAHVEFQQLATPPVVTADIYEKQGYLTDDLPEPKGALVRARIHVDLGGGRFAGDVTRALYDAGALFVQTEIIRPVRQSAAAAGKLLAPLEALQQALGDRDDAPGILELAAQQLERLAVASGAGGLGTLHLRRIRAENVMRLVHADVDFDGSGIVSVTGPVGSGKSALFCDVPRLALTGASRMGERAGEELIRDGATEGEVQLWLAADDGREFSFLRTFKQKRGGGVTSTLNVLECRPGSLWGPLTDGKVASGEAMIAQLTGGLDDRTLKASTFVVQRESDSFTSARPEDRKRVLADAAGLGHLDVLAKDALDRAREATAEMGRRDREAEVLRPKVDELLELAAEADKAEEALPALEEAMRGDRAAAAAAKAALDAAVARETERQSVQDASVRANRIHIDLQHDAVNLELDLSAMLQRRDDLDAITARLASKAERDAIDVATAERKRDEAYARGTEGRLAEVRRADAFLELNRIRFGRDRDRAIIDGALNTARERAALIDQAKCCAPEPSCVLLADARAAAATILALEAKLDPPIDPRQKELEDLLGWTLPETVDVRPFENALREATSAALGRQRDVERQKELTADVTRIPELEERRASLRARVEQAKEDLAAAMARERELGAAADVAGLRRKLDNAEANQARMQEHFAQLGRRIAFLRGRAETLDAIRKELANAEAAAAESRGFARAFTELNASWKTARVLILEHSIIPSVERTANEILALSPTGLTLRLDRSEGDDLELRLEGGLAPSYKLASGGQRTWVDVALHIAIALVVAQRVQTRLDFIFVDEPEGLDAENRAHFGRVLRWVHDTHGLMVLAASHHEDLVELVADRVITLAPAAEGTTV